MNKDPLSNNFKGYNTTEAPPVYPAVPESNNINRGYQPVNQYGYSPNQPNQYVLIQQPSHVVMNTRATGTYPQQITCPACRATVITRVETKPGLGTWLICGGICLLGFWFGCQFIPFCIDECKDHTHYCPNCNAVVGEKKLLN